MTPRLDGGRKPAWAGFASPKPRRLLLQESHSTGEVESDCRFVVLVSSLGLALLPEGVGDCDLPVAAHSAGDYVGANHRADQLGGPDASADGDGAGGGAGDDVVIRHGPGHYPVASHSRGHNLCVDYGPRNSRRHRLCVEDRRVH